MPYPKSAGRAYKKHGEKERAVPLPRNPWVIPSPLTLKAGLQGQWN